MAVYKRTYRGYSGQTTPTWSRFLVLYRSARRSLFRSKFHTAFFVLCFFFPLLCLLGIYANAHVSALSFLSKKTGPFLDVNGSFFYSYMSIQSALAFLLTAFIGPGLVSPDLANGALTLYLCRPLSRGEYVLGKFSVLAITLSWITWVPGLVLFFSQAAVSPGGWMVANVSLAIGILVGSFLWITVLSLLSLALSAWVKWRVIAGALLLAIFFMGAGFAHAVNAVLNTNLGYLLDVSTLISTVENSLFRYGSQSIPVSMAWMGLLGFAGVCLFLLMRKVRPNEVIE